MIRLCAAALAAVVGLTAAGAVEEKEKKDQPLKGVWVREFDGGKVTIDYKSKDKLTVTVEPKDGGKLTAICKYEADKDGAVKGSITEVEGDLPNKPPVGYEFKWKFKVDGDKAKLADFEGENSDAAKAIMEGDYKKKKGD